LQRSILMELDKTAKAPAIEGQGADNEGSDANEAPAPISYDAGWKRAQLERFGGRAAWLSHHLFVLHKFFEAVQTKWNMSYQAKHRLINLEQSLCLLADLFEIDNSWIPNYLVGQTSTAVLEADWILDGLKTFCQTALKHKAEGTLKAFAAGLGAPVDHGERLRFGAGAIAAWASSQDEYSECISLTNPRKLGRYLTTHKSMIVQVCSLHEDGSLNNRTMYLVRPSLALVKTS
jgi:hypothetical protein